MDVKPMAGTEISARRQAVDRAFLAGLDAVAGAARRHWLLMLNIASGALAVGAFLAPVFLSLGRVMPAQWIYYFYSSMCHQLPYRSYFVLEYQVAQCQRNTAIYASMLAAGLVFARYRHRIKPVDWRLYVLLIAPMAVDGFSQLFGFRESTWQLRTVTGSLFGAACVWIAYPHIEHYLDVVRPKATAKVHQVVLYSKPDCSLCDRAKEVLERLRQEYPVSIAEVDITGDPELFQRYRNLIPVIHVDGRPAAVSKVSEVWLRRKLDDLASSERTVAHWQKLR